MTDEVKKKRIHASPWDVVCPGCGKTIYESDDMSEIEYVRTKRRTDVFFHRKCMNKVWTR